MSDIPIVPDDNLRLALVQVVKLLHFQNERLGRIHATLLAHRRAIAATQEHPEEVEEQIRLFEVEAQNLALEDQGFPEAAALVALLEVGKNPDTFDA